MYGTLVILLYLSIHRAKSHLLCWHYAWYFWQPILLKNYVDIICLGLVQGCGYICKCTWVNWDIQVHMSRYKHTLSELSIYTWVDISIHDYKCVPIPGQIIFCMFLARELSLGLLYALLFTYYSFQTSHSLYPLFLLYSHAISYYFCIMHYSLNFYCVSDNNVHSLFSS